MEARSREFRKQLKELYFQSLNAVSPQVVLPQLFEKSASWLRVSDHTGQCSWKVARDVPVTLIGAGKGSALIAAELEKLLGPQIRGGMVIVPEGYEHSLSRTRLAVGGHPLPDERNLVATARLLRLVSQLEPGQPVVVIITGGASALLVAPAPGIEVCAKRQLTHSLLRSGATISEMNAVRKHLSLVKGGQLARQLAGRPVLTLVVSDVMGDDIATIGSGPTVPDPTTFSDASAVLQRYGLWEKAGQAIRERIEQGVCGRVRETPKPGELPGPGDPGQESLAVILATNDTARRAAAEIAAKRGWMVKDLGCVISGDTAKSARKLMQNIITGLRCLSPEDPPLFLVAGGETTVKVEGEGMGGRNQEFALAAAELLAGRAGLALLSAGSDGIDGPTDAAGAFADATTAARAADQGLDLGDFLRRHDSYNFFSLLGDLFKPGPTGVNVMDLKFLLVKL